MRFIKALVTLVASWPAVLSSPVQQRALTTLPSEDSFYQAPVNISSYSPGSIIRYRKPPSPIAAFGLDPVNIQDSWQLLYRTNDNHDNAVATVLTVLVPHNADLTKILSYQVAEDAASINCAPSYALQLASATSGFLGTIVTQAELLLIEAGLSQGWVVILPDHEGPSGAFLANKQAGQATLDGIRAALQSSSFTGIRNDSPTITMWGYSGGSIASGWAAELQPTYAPELRIAGAAIGGVVPSIPPVINLTNATPFAGLIPTGVTGLTHQYPELKALVNQHLLPQYKAEFAKIESQCFVQDVLDYFGKDVVKMLDDPSVLTSEPAKSILQANAMGKAAPKLPLYVYKSLNDEVSAIGETDTLVNFYCSQGTSVTYARDFASEHGALAVTGAPAALGWLIDRMSGKPASSKCSTKTVFSSLADPVALRVLPGFLLNAFLDLLGAPIGPAFFG